MKDAPNILLVFTDQQQQKLLGCYGNTTVQTPCIDALSREGATFENAIVAQPVCTASRASLLTGTYGHTHGCVKNNQVLTEENLTMTGEFHSFKNVTSLPRPTQQPSPPIWVAALQTPETFEFAGRSGFHCMANPIGGAKLGELLGVYREAWSSAGHPGQGQVALAFIMYCAPSTDQAIAEAGDGVKAYFETLTNAASDWSSGASTKDYPGYDKLVEILSKEDVHSQREKSAALVGGPDDICDMLADFSRQIGGFDIASLQVNTKLLDLDLAKASMRLFANEVIPRFASAPRAA